MPEHRAVVIGAGVAGLCAAIDLARQGVAVTVLERAAEPGGKLRQLQVGGVPVDSGPTVFTMRWIFDGLFEDAGTRLEDCLRLQPLRILARHAWGTGGRLDLHASAEASAQAIGEFSSPAEARRFLAFCAQARRVYQSLEGPYIRSARPSLVGITRDLGVTGLLELMRLGPLRSLWKSLARHFHDPRLQQLFGRYATYCGASPMRAPATLMLVAQVEMDGVWAIEGGMGALARALATLARGLGVQVRCDADCHRIAVERGRACGVVLRDGERIVADTVVLNGDVGTLAAGLFGEDARVAATEVPVQARSLSALTWSMRAHASGFPLVRHNVFFDADYASEFDDIFRWGRLPSRPTVYLCAQDRDDEAKGPVRERMLALVNAPALGDRRQFEAQEIQACEQRAFGLMSRCGLQLATDPQDTAITTPEGFNRLFPATGGALYGRASHGWMTPFMRPGSLSRLPGLWLAGGSVHPGPGVPMAAMSGRLAAAAIMRSIGVRA